jgi:hypothetical protein
LATYAVIPVRDKHPQTFALLSQLGLPAERVVVVDGGSRIPAKEALSGLADVVECAQGGVAELWNAGLDRVASLSNGIYNVAILANTIVVDPGFLSGLAAGLRGSRDRVIAYPDWERRLPAGDCDPEGPMSGFAFMLRGEDGLRADPQFVQSWASVDLERWARLEGEVVCVGGVHANDRAPVPSETSDPGAAQSDEDRQRFEAKWGTTPA